MDLSIIIVNWNVKDYLRKCLESIYRLTADIDFEVFVVDNNSSDGSQAMVSAEFPLARLITNTQNLGFSKANNQAIRESCGRYILLLNPDTRFKDNSLKAMAAFMDSRADIDCLAPQLLYGDGLAQRSCRHFPSLFTDIMENLYLDSLFSSSRIFNRYRMGSWGHDQAGEVDQPYGACLLFRSDVFKKIGLMDERFFMYYDEVDLCFRLKKAGGVIYFLPDFKVIHYSNKSSKQISAVCEGYKYRSKFLFFAKHYGRCAGIALFLSLSARSLLTWGIFPALHLLCGRPRDLSHFNQYLKIIWSEYAKLIREQWCLTTKS